MPSPNDLNKEQNSEFSKTLLLTAKLWSRIKKGSDIDEVLPRLPPETTKRQKAAVQSQLYLTVRNRVLVQWLVDRLAKKTPPENLAAVLEVALACAVGGKEKSFVLVHESVKAVKSEQSLQSGAPFINAVLRRFYREKQELLAQANLNEAVLANAPQWWIDAYRNVFGEEADEIFAVQKEQPPLVLRVNERKCSRGEYLQRLLHLKISALPVGLQGVVLAKPTAVHAIPWFSKGVVSVQDAGSQLAAQILAPESGMKVLDTCAAPGGKMCHLMELADVEMTAVEKIAKKAPRIYENLERLGFKAEVIIDDVLNFVQEYKGAPFDRILLDAPCSASGVVRRHPEIPWIRKEKDIKILAQTQRQILEKSWNILANHGKILYSVCSVFPEEGIDQIRNFLANTPDARLCAFEGAPDGVMLLSPHQGKPDRKFIPWVSDGFFFALLEKV